MAGRIGSWSCERGGEEMWGLLLLDCDGSFSTRGLQDWTAFCFFAWCLLRCIHRCFHGSLSIFFSVDRCCDRFCAPVLFSLEVQVLCFTVEKAVFFGRFCGHFIESMCCVRWQV